MVAAALTTMLAAALLPGGSQLMAPRSAVLPRASPLVCEATAAADIETPKMESACGFDFVPLQTALLSGEFREADFITRAALITIAGEAAVKRGYVYFTDVLPDEDMATIERLWNAYSDGKFGYTVQRAAYNSKKVDRNLEKMFDRIGWRNKEKKLLRWLPEAKGDEFIYDLEKAPKGHLPLTSTLRGQQLLTKLLNLPVWEKEEFEGIKI